MTQATLPQLMAVLRRIEKLHELGESERAVEDVDYYGAVTTELLKKVEEAQNLWRALGSPAKTTWPDNVQWAVRRTGIVPEDRPKPSVEEGIAKAAERFRLVKLVEQNINQALQVDNLEISMGEKGVALVFGIVDDEAERERALEAARRTEGIQNVDDRLRVRTRVVLVYKRGSEYAPDSPQGEDTITFYHSHSFDVENRTRGAYRFWTGGLHPRVIDHIVSLLQAAGFPALPERSMPVPGALRTLVQGDKAVTVGWNAGKSLPGYNNLFKALDEIADCAHGGKCPVVLSILELPRQPPER
jgi:hypothetical protein